jgi:Gpi18-like mannosyltransferase
MMKNENLSKNIFLAGSTYIVIILIASFFLYTFSPLHSPNGWPYPLALANWDGGNYLSIASLGYHMYYLHAFFPLYPVLIWLINHVVMHIIVTALLISWTSFLIGLYFFYKLLRLDYPQIASQYILLTLLCFPMSFYFVMTYSESLFFILSIASFYCMRTDKVKLAAFFALLSSLTRPFGVLVIVSLLVESWYRKRHETPIIILSLSGILGYMFYNYTAWHDPLLFIKVQSLWHRGVSFSGINIFAYLAELIRQGLTEDNFASWIEYLFLIFGIGIGFRVTRFLRPSYAVYSSLSLAVPLLTGSLASYPRLMLVNFPIFIVLAMWSFKKTESHRIVELSYFPISLSLLVIFLAIFIYGYWIA